MRLKIRDPTLRVRAIQASFLLIHNSKMYPLGLSWAFSTAMHLSPIENTAIQAARLIQAFPISMVNNTRAA